MEFIKEEPLPSISHLALINQYKKLRTKIFNDRKEQRRVVAARMSSLQGQWVWFPPFFPFLFVFFLQQIFGVGFFKYFFALKTV